MKYILALFLLCLASPSYAQSQSFNPNAVKERIEGVVYASDCASDHKPAWCSGDDIGAWVNAALDYADSQGYEEPFVKVKNGTYAITTTIGPVSVNDTIDFSHSVLTRSATDGVAFLLGQDSGDIRGTGKIKNLKISGSGSVSGSDVAFYAGGDPSGVISPTTDFFSANQVLENIEVSGFRTVFTYGNNAWATKFLENKWVSNYDGFVQPVGTLTNSGERFTFSNSMITNQINCGVKLTSIDSGDVLVTNSWVDYNGAAMCGSGNITINNSHVEMSHGYLFDLTGITNLTISNSWLAKSGTTNDDGWIRNVSANSNIHLSNIIMSQNNATTYLIDTDGLTDSLNLTYDNIMVFNSPGFTRNWRSVTDAPGIKTGNRFETDNPRGSGNIALTSDGTYQIAAGSRIQGTYDLSWSGSNREEKYTIDVVANAYDQAFVSVRNAHDFGGNKVFSNFRVVGNSDGSARYFVVDVSNRNGSTGYMTVTARGKDSNISLKSTPDGSTPVTNYTNLIGSRNGNNGIGTQTPKAGLHVATGQLLVNGGIAPTLGSCGTGAVIGGSDSSFNILVGTGGTTSCIVNFGSIWGEAPDSCTVTPANSTAADQATTGMYIDTPTSGSITLNGLNLSGARYFIHCY